MCFQCYTLQGEKIINNTKIRHPIRPFCYKNNDINAFLYYDINLDEVKICTISAINNSNALTFIKNVIRNALIYDINKFKSEIINVSRISYEIEKNKIDEIAISLVKDYGSFIEQYVKTHIYEVAIIDNPINENVLNNDIFKLLILNQSHILFSILFYNNQDFDALFN